MSVASRKVDSGCITRDFFFVKHDVRYIGWWCKLSAVSVVPRGVDESCVANGVSRHGAYLMLCGVGRLVSAVLFSCLRR